MESNADAMWFPDEDEIPNTVRRQVEMASIEASAGDSGGNGNGNGNSSDDGIRGRGGPPDLDPFTRPAGASVGNNGKPIKLIANYFKLQINSNLNVYQYHAEFEPLDIERSLRRAVIRNHRDLFNAYVYDDRTTIFTVNHVGDEREFVEPLLGIEGRLTIERKKDTSREPRQSIEMLRVYNNQIRKFMGHYLNFVQIKRYMYSPQEKVDLPYYNVSIWPGNVTAINRHDVGILLCVDLTFRVVRTDNVLEILKKLKEQNPQHFREEALKQLAGKSVVTVYNNKSYRIDDIYWQGRPGHAMADDNSGNTYVDHYRELYNVRIQELDQPLLFALRHSNRNNSVQFQGLPKPVILVPELCLVTGLSEAMLNDFQMKKAVSIHTRRDPTEYVQTVKRFMEELTSNADVQSDMGKLGTRYSSDVLEVPGRVLAHEMILGKDENHTNCIYLYDHKTDDFIAQITSRPLRSTVELRNWAIIATEDDRDCVDKLANTIRRVRHAMQIGVNKPTVKLVPNPETRSFIEECKRVDANIDMVVVISPDNNSDRYSAIKKLYCCEMGILSQVVLAENVRSKGFMSTCSKVALQVACKMGAEAWAVHIPQQDIMVVGFDTYDDIQARWPRRSVGAFVCSRNPGLTKWYSRVNYHMNQEELRQHFCQNMTTGLQAYYNTNGRFPGWVVVYRNGIPDDAIKGVHMTERLEIEKTIKKANIRTCLTFILVSKKINTRLFVPKERNYANPPPGTVVDTVITRPTRFEFYLVSRTVKEGTVSPTSFNIIHDDSGKSANIHQVLAYRMTHMYYNFPGTIGVPAPCQYAYKLAFLTATVLHRKSHVRLHDKLFYL